jgi:hypothetical protein
VLAQTPQEAFLEAETVPQTSLITSPSLLPAMPQILGTLQQRHLSWPPAPTPTEVYK